MAQAQQGDPKALMAVIEVRKNPNDMQSILEKFYTPKEPQMSPEEEALLGGGPQPPTQPQGPPPGIAQMLMGLGG